jgi:hypothetical protein
MKAFLKFIGFVVAGSLILSSCQTANPYTGQSQRSKALTGSVIGGLLGAGIGSLTGSGSTDRRQKAMIGAGIGALAELVPTWISRKPRCVASWRARELV